MFTGDTGADANAINGCLTLISNVGSNAVVGLTDASAGTSMSLSSLDEAIDKVKGSALRSDLVIVGSFAGLRKVNAALQSDQQFTDVTEIAAGFRVRTYDGIPLVVSTQMPDTLEPASGGASLLTFDGGTSTALAILNKRHCWIEELTPTTVMPLAKDSSQYDQFDMFWDGTYVHSNTKGGSLLIGISTT